MRIEIPLGRGEYAMKIVGCGLPNIPWENKPNGCREPVWRFSGNPILGRNEVYKARRIFNSAVVPFGDGFAGVFRADGRDGKARLHAGFSADALHWEISGDVINWKDEAGVDWNPGYAYDPRVVLLDGRYYAVWCTDFGAASLGMGSTEDFVHFTRHENPFIPFNRNGVLFPRKIGGTYRMLTRPSDSGHTPFGDIYLSESPDLVHWGKHRKVMGRSASGWWQGLKIGGGAVVETTEAWLLFYHGVCMTCNGYVYSMGAALLDLDEPSRVLHRSSEAVLMPEAPYETTGFVDNVVFPCAVLADADTGRMAIYYGCADTHTGVCFTDIDTIVKYIKDTSVLEPGDADIGR
jgi:beta-1,4-mannooligosaccharide/beta-1,4-mannosyl-N-acetylglucosamine phosphorylase